MTRRGQVTLASLGLAFVLALGWLVEPFGAVRAALNPELDVAAAAIEARSREPDVDSLSPAALRALFERLPITRASLELPATEAGGGATPGRIYENVAATELAPRL